MSYQFSSLEDCPDIDLHPGQWIIARYSYLWGPLPRTRNFQRAIPIIHLKDLLKMREQALQQLWIRNQHLIMGDPPKLFNYEVHITDTA